MSWAHHQTYYGEPTEQPAWNAGAFEAGYSEASTSGCGYYRQPIPQHREQSIHERDLAAENADLHRRLQDAEYVISRLKISQDTAVDMHEKDVARIRELTTDNDKLKNEVANLRAQISYATDTLKTQITQQINNARDENGPTAKLKGKLIQQREAFRKLKKEKNLAVKQLERFRNNESKDKAAARSRARRRRRREVSTSSVPMSTPDPTSTIAPDVPSSYTEGFIKKRFIDDENLTDQVLQKLIKAFSEPKPARNLTNFFTNGARGVYFCFHEVCERGALASSQMHTDHPECHVGSAKCSFMVKRVQVGRNRKLQIFNLSVSKQESG
ncbi:hypothetical protein ACHAPJ_011074 [Fusarium lateritium]